MVVILNDDRVTDVGHPPVITGTAERPVQILCLFTNSEINRGFYEKNSFTLFDERRFEYGGKSVSSWSYSMKL